MQSVVFGNVPISGTSGAWLLLESPIFAGGSVALPSSPPWTKPLLVGLCLPKVEYWYLNSASPQYTPTFLCRGLPGCSFCTNGLVIGQTATVAILQAGFAS